MSEYPAGVKPVCGQFPERNRLISGLSDAVVVVEARAKSGSLITVDQALEQNKDVYVIPGRVGDSLSEGCNELIKSGAYIMTKAEDILECDRIKISCQALTVYRNICKSWNLYHNLNLQHLKIWCIVVWICIQWVLMN